MNGATTELAVVVSVHAILGANVIDVLSYGGTPSVPAVSALNVVVSPSRRSASS